MIMITIVVMIGDRYRLYDDDNNDDHVIIFYSIKGD